MRIPGGIRVRIALALVGIVTAALGAAYLIVIPSLEQRLVDARLDQLEQAAAPLARDLPANQFRWQRTVDSWALETNARVVAYSVLTRNPPSTAVGADSQRGRSRDVANDDVVLDAVESGEQRRGRVMKGGGDFAEVAVPLEWGAACCSGRRSRTR